MKSKDQVQLEEAYQRILLKEDPDECVIGRNEIESLTFGIPGAVTFGFSNIGTNPFIVKNHYGDDMFQLEGFDDSNYGKLMTSKKVHGDIAQEIFKTLSKSPQGKITFLDNYNTFKSEAFDQGDVLDLSNPEQAKRIKDFFTHILSQKVDELDYYSRTFLAPSGRIWVNQQKIKDIYQKEFQADVNTVISFWADKDQVTPKHFQDLVAHFKLVPQNTMVEFLGDVEPSTRLDAIVGSSAPATQPELSKEEQEEREKRKAASLAKVHAAAAVGTKDKDVQDIMDQRKKTTSDRESQLRASGVRPSLAQRQQAMSSESTARKSKDQQLLEEAYAQVHETMTHKSLQRDAQGFNMNPDQEEALKRLRDAYLNQTITLVKTVKGPDEETHDTYQGPTKRPLRVQALADEEVVTGVVTDIKGVREAEEMDHVFNRPFRGERVDLVFVVDGEEYNIDQQRLRVKGME